MELEKYQRVVAINDRLKELEEAYKEIDQSVKNKLKYVGDDNRGLADWKMKYIGEILDKHDKMIRAEIQQEIDSLKAEIIAL